MIFPLSKESKQVFHTLFHTCGKVVEKLRHSLRFSTEQSTKTLLEKGFVLWERPVSHLLKTH